MKIMIIVGARPNFMKAAPLLSAIRTRNARESGHSAPAESIHAYLVHTGQHYDLTMSDSFFSDLALPKPDECLAVGSASHAMQTAEIMRRFEQVVLREMPDVLTVVGDVNSTVACALVAAKITYDAGGKRPLIAHVEAGLRSFDRSMPEEVNRVVTDHLADLLFTTERSGMENLLREGIASEKIHFVGNTMIDCLLASKENAERSTILAQLRLRNGHPGNGSRNGARRYALLTLHRPSNVDDRDTFLRILQGVEELSSSCPILFPVHPRTAKRITEYGLESRFVSANGQASGNGSNGHFMSAGIHLLGPLGYLDFLCLMQHAVMVITDSGGIQEETTCLGIPCVTVRENTERPVTVSEGTNMLSGTSSDRIRLAIAAQTRRNPSLSAPEMWDGQAASRIVDILAEKACKVMTVQ